MKMTCTMPDHAAVVEALLEGFVRACQVCIAAGLAPPDPLQTNVKYQQEPEGQEDWVLPQNVMRAGWGDCEDLAGWRAGGLRHTGEDPDARAIVVRTGPKRLHCVVLRSDGQIDDPSRDIARRDGNAKLGAARTFRGGRTAVGPMRRRRGDDQPGLSPGVENPDDGSGQQQQDPRAPHPGDTWAQAFLRRHPSGAAPRVLKHTTGTRKEGERHDAEGNVVNDETAAAADQQAQQDALMQQQQQQLYPGYAPGAYGPQGPYGMPYLPQQPGYPGSYFEGLQDTVWDPNDDYGDEEAA